MSVTYNLYREQVVTDLMKSLECKNIMQVPKLSKIVVSTGVGKGNDNKSIEDVKKFISIITGQMPSIRKAKKSVSNFKTRRGMPIGVMVTLRKGMMYNFFDKLVNIVLPQLRDFKGVSSNGFDRFGNYNLGISDISVFMELDLNIVKQQIGINIAFVTTANNSKEAFELLKGLKMPFKVNKDINKGE
jgi:large subunit ribosomal protein L5